MKDKFKVVEDTKQASDEVVNQVGDLFK